MKQILVFGAGRSSVYLIEYLAGYCTEQGIKLLVCDKDVQYASGVLKDLNAVEFENLDISNTILVQDRISKSELVVSLLPAALHIEIARFCLSAGKSLATASYISDAMRALDEEVKAKGLIFLNEIGLDPGIDHMSAVQMIEKIKANGGIIKGFKSYCGGLIADEDDGDNPWKYKFSWNPRNVVVAAQGPPATYLEYGKLKVRPYHRVFNAPELCTIASYGTLEAYPNRDSLSYMELYGLQGVETMLRGTLRKQGYSSAWQVLVLLGMTDDTQNLDLKTDTTLFDWLSMYIPGTTNDYKDAVKKLSGCSDTEIQKLEWLGLFSEELVPIQHGTSAKVLEELLKKKWVLQANDKDMVVMLHEIHFYFQGKNYIHRASMVLKGESNTHTAMAKTVGLPLAVACTLLLNGKISERGVIAPVYADIYIPVLEELSAHGIMFEETTVEDTLGK